MGGRWKWFAALALALVAVIGVSYLLQRGARPLRLVINIHPYVGDEALVLSDYRYTNPGGPGRFSIRDFQFFLSNIRLLGKSGDYSEAESYHLVRFDSEDGTFTLTLDNVPGRDYQRIEFGIGVDAKANGTITVSGDLDPNSRMAWSWDVGYKFVLFEGGLKAGERFYPLVYHVGFDENYQTISLPLDASVLTGDAPGLNLRVDVLKMFNAESLVDMAELTSVKFDRTDAAILAANYVNMLALCAADCR
jgi:hypothetical protein